MISEVLSKSWDAYKRNFWGFVGAILLVGIIVGVLAVLSFIPLFMGLVKYADAFGSSSPSFSGFMSAVPLSWLVISAAGFVLTIILSIALGAGLVKFSADALKGRAEIGKIFSTAREKLWTVLGAHLLSWVVLIPLFLLLIAPPILLLASELPSMVVASSAQAAAALFPALAWLLAGSFVYLLATLFFQLINQSVVVGNMKAVDSVRNSISVVSQNYLEFLGLVLILLLISFALGFVPYIGGLIRIFAILPLTLIAYTAFYIEKAGAGRRGRRKSRK